MLAHERLEIWVVLTLQNQTPHPLQMQIALRHARSGLPHGPSQRTIAPPNRVKSWVFVNLLIVAPKFREASVRFGHGSGVERFRFSVPAVPLQKRFFFVSVQFNRKGLFRFRFGSWKTVPAVPLSVWGKTQDKFDHDKGQKSAISGHRLHWRLSIGFFAFSPVLCAI